MNDIDYLKQISDTLQKRMFRVGKSVQPLPPELGTIAGNLSLIPDSKIGTIPPGAYYVSRSLQQPETWTFTQPEDPDYPDGYHTHSGGISGGGHQHKIPLPETFQPLQAGDRVLIIWCGYTPVVADIVSKGGGV